MLRSRIAGLGFHVPEHVVKNSDLERMMDTTDAWIIERTGIRERRFAAPGVGSSDLGFEAPGGGERDRQPSAILRRFCRHPFRP